jgi:hypothetical protein
VRQSPGAFESTPGSKAAGDWRTPSPGADSTVHANEAFDVLAGVRWQALIHAETPEYLNFLKLAPTTKMIFQTGS